MSIFIAMMLRGRREMSECAVIGRRLRLSRCALFAATSAGKLTADSTDSREEKV